MAEYQGNHQRGIQQDEEIDVNRDSSVAGNVSLSQAKAMALRTAQANPGRQRWILKRKMLFDVLDGQEDENSYTIMVSFYPGTDFEGMPGQERFRFSKAGRFEDRQLLSHPKHSRLIPITRKAVVIGVVAVLVAIAFAALVIVLARGNRCPAIDCQDNGASSPTHPVELQTGELQTGELQTRQRV